MIVHLSEKEMEVMITKPNDNTEDPLKKNQLLIPSFDIHHKTVGNENGSNHISTIVFAIKCNPKKTSLIQTILVRFSEDHNDNFTFIPYGLLQMTNVETYRRQIIFQNNYIA